MCGRYSQTSDLAALERRFGLEAQGLEVLPRYNLAPGQEAPVVLVEEGRRVLRPLRWGLVPAWASDPAAGYKMINARAETLAVKPAFRGAYLARRCLVPADGFYEWRPAAKGRPKEPLRFTLADGGLFAMAGLWERWQPPDGEPLHSFSIITVAANPLVAAIHDRMPALLPPGQEAAWLDPSLRDPVALATLLAPYPPEQMRAYPVSPALNRPQAEGPGLIEPWQPQGPGGLFE